MAGEGDDREVSSELRQEDADCGRSEPEDENLSPDEMAQRPESMPLIHIEGDYNANTILDRKCSISNPIMHLNPRREGRVVLPKRYQNQLKAYKEKQSESQAANGQPTNSSNGPSSSPMDTGGNPDVKEMSTTNLDGTSPDSSVSDKWSDRLEDLDLALKWIRQELIQIKQEDRFLMRRLLDLTAQIHLIQGRPSNLSLSANLALLGSCGSDLDIATWSSFMSLDDQALLERSKASDSTLMLKELMAYVHNRLAPPTPGTTARGLRGYGCEGLSDIVSRSVSTREATRPPLRIKRKNSLPTENELEEDHFFDDDSY